MNFISPEKMPQSTSPSTVQSSHPDRLSIGLFGQFDKRVRHHLREHRVIELETPKTPSLAASIQDLDGIVIRSPFKLDDACAQAARRLKWIIRAGSGTDNISPKFGDGGVTIRTTPINAHSVAELVLGLTLGLLRHVRPGHESLRAGLWHKQALVGRELRGKTVGVLGYGRIGRDVSVLMALLGTKVLAYDRTPQAPEKQAVAKASGTRLLDLDTVVASSDVLVACLPGSAQTRHLFDRERLSQMRKGALLVNVGRGSLVDIEALTTALEEGRIGGAALDVFTTEPPGSLRLFEMNNVLCTPHLGAQTLETHHAIGMRVVSILDELIALSIPTVPRYTPSPKMG